MQFLKYTLLSLFCSSAVAGIAQESIKVDFYIKDQKLVPVPVADVTFLNPTDSAVITSTFPDGEGWVTYEAAKGESFIVKIECLEFLDTTFLVNQPIANKSLGNIILRSNEKNLLNEVVISGQRSAMDLKIDKRVYNVQDDINAQGATASEVLENIPSVTVDAEGSVSLRGNSNVRILINGKLSGFASTGDALRMLQADAIERIEVVTNASSRYDAEGDAGVINIILKKGRGAGLNAIFNVRGGYNPDNGAGLRLNYRVNKLNLFADYNFNYSNHPGRSMTYQRLINADTQMIYNQSYLQNREKIRHNMRVGADYDWNSKHNTSFDISYRTGVGNNDIERIYDNLTAANQLINSDNRNEINTELEDLIEMNLSHNYQFSEKGSWNTSFNFYTDQDLERSMYTEQNSLSPLMKRENSSAYVYNDVLQAQTDLILPIGKEGKLETGFKFQNRIFDNEFRYTRQVAPNQWDAPLRYNDDVTYNEKVYAAYLMGSTTINKWGLQAGLRAEYSDIYTKLKSAEKSSKDYLNFFPSAAVSYKMNDKNNLQWSLSRRITRPGQWDLLPFMKFGDNREMRQGNANLNPELTYSTEVTWMHYLKKGSILTSMYYRHTVDKIERIAYYGTDGIIYRMPLNIASRDAYGLEAIGNYQLTNWLRFNTSFNFFREQISGEYMGTSFDRDNFTWNNRSSLNFALPKGIKFQVSGQYDAPRLSAQGKILSMRWMDLAASKDIWKNKATVGVNLRDVFNSRRFRSVTDTPEIYSENDFQWRPRSVRVTFTYRLNQTKKLQENFFNEGGGGGEM